MKERPKRALCVMDLSVTGRAGLSAVVPVLAACGVQACGLPTALFSTHTGGFGPVARQDAAAFCQQALGHYAREGVDFDAVYVGYLYNDAQYEAARQALAQYPDALHVVDPALGDDGKPYGGIGQAAVGHMRALCAEAELITPNFTESAMLTGEEALPARLDALAEEGRRVLVTSVPGGTGGWATHGRDEDGRDFTIPGRHVPQRYPGTGDTFTAAVVGLMLRGMDFEAAARKATAFVEAAAHATYAAGAEARHGLWVEPHLPMLAES